MASKFSARECIPIEYIEEQMQEYSKFDHLRANAEFLDWFIKDYRDNAMANYEWQDDIPHEPQIIACPIQEEDSDYARWLYEPQTDSDIGCSRCGSRYVCFDRYTPNAVHCNNYGKITDEPQTDKENE